MLVRKRIAATMGAIRRETCPLTFSDSWDIIYHVPHIFIFRSCVWRGFKNKSDACHVLCEELFMLNVTHNQLMLKQVWCGITDSDIV